MVLLRHGHSAGNAAGSFTGWRDVPLTDRGRAEAARAAELLVEHGCAPAVVHTSVLARAVDTAAVAIGELVARGAAHPWARQDWRLNERHYGALQGCARSAVVERYGAEQFTRWRRGFSDVPPPVPPDHPDHPARDPRYAGLPAGLLPGAESLADVRDRVARWWSGAAARLRPGVPVLVVAHSNSLRALCMLLDDLAPAEVERLDLPTGVPLRYDLDADLVPWRRGGAYLDPEAARVGVAEVRSQGHRDRSSDG